LKIEEIENGSSFDEQTSEIRTFDVLPESYKNEIQEKINNIDNWNDRMAERVSELDKIIESKNSEISSLQSEMDSLKEKNNSLESDVSNLKSEMSAAKGDLENLYADFSVIQEIINDQQERGLLSFVFPKTAEQEAEEILEEPQVTETTDTPTIFAVLPEINSAMLIGLVIVVIIIGAFLFIRSRGIGFGSGNSFYSDTEFFGMDDEPHSSGKWALGNERKNTGFGKSESTLASKTGKKFHMSDLLRKD